MCVYKHKVKTLAAMPAVVYPRDITVHGNTYIYIDVSISYAYR